jgi:Oxygenase domain of the 2OGFeDO superfamily
MNTLFLEHDYRKLAAGLTGKFPDSSHVDLTLDADTRVITTEGIICAVLLCGVIPRKFQRLAYKLWKSVDHKIDNRVTAVGTKSLPRFTRKDGTPSPRLGVHVRVLEGRKARQGFLGYSDRPCRKTDLTEKYPHMIDRNSALVQLMDDLYKQHTPALYAIQRAEVQKAPFRYRLCGTVFTSIYITKNFRTAYHVDKRNLRGVMTALMPLGKFTGGELVLPRWRIAFAFRPGDLLLFDPQELHGNLPFKGERLSAAFYCARRIADCANRAEA